MNEVEAGNAKNALALFSTRSVQECKDEPHLRVIGELDVAAHEDHRKVIHQRHPADLHSLQHDLVAVDEPPLRQELLPRHH